MLVHSAPAREAEADDARDQRDRSNHRDRGADPEQGE
jgi:hypothetical protein